MYQLYLQVLKGKFTQNQQFSSNPHVCMSLGRILNRAGDGAVGLWMCVDEQFSVMAGLAPCVTVPHHPQYMNGVNVTCGVKHLSGRRTRKVRHKCSTFTIWIGAFCERTHGQRDSDTATQRHSVKRTPSCWNPPTSTYSLYPVALEITLHKQLCVCVSLSLR